MPTRKDNTIVAPIYQQQFIPFKGAKKIMWDSLPKINGRRIASGAIDVVSPEFDLLTGIRGLANMVKPKTYKSIINNGDYNPIISEIDNAVNQGIQMGRDYINNPIVQSTLEHNRQLYKRLFGKPQNMIYINKHGEKVLANNRGELLSNAVSYPIQYKFGKLPKKVSGEYNRSKDMTGNITLAENLSPSITKHSAFHETLHHGAYGNYDGIIYDLKAEKLFPNNAYLRAGHEAAANTAEVGRDMGLALGQKYPGRQVFRDMLDNLLAKPYYKDFVIKDAKLDTNRDYKRLWDALTGKYFTTAGAAATGLSLTNNNKMKCGGRRKGEFGLDIQYGGRAIPIGKNMVYFDGNSHENGGIGVGNKLEVEGGEVGEYKDNTLRVFSSVPFLQGVSPAQLVMGGANPDVVFKAQETFKDRNRINDDGTRYTAGGIYIKPSKRGTFTAAATKRGMGVQEFANKVLANKEDYSPAMVKKANFARNASRWKKEYGGEDNVLPEIVVTPRSNYGKIYDASGINKRKKIAQDVLQILPFSGFVNDVLGFTNPINAGGAVKSAMGYGAAKAGLPFLSIPGIAYNGVLGLPDLIQDVQNLYKDIKTPKEEFNRKKKEYGGSMIYTINGNVKNGLMSARPKAQYGKTIKINRDSYETVDEAVERYKQLYRIRYGKEPSKSNVNRVAWMKTLETAIAGDPNLITGYGPNVGVRGPNVTKIVSGVNKGRQIARTQTAVRNKNVKSATPQRQAVNTKVSQAARNERLSQFDIWQQGEPFQASTMPTDAIAISRQPISTGVRSGRKGRVDDVIAIKRSQRNAGVDPLASKKPYSNYDDLYAEKFYSTSKLLPYTIVGSVPVGLAAQRFVYDEPSETVEEVTDSINNNKDSVSKTNNNTKKPKTPVSNDKKNTANNDTDNAYVSTTTVNTGDSYRINPITGEWIRNNIVETPEPSIKGTTRVTSKPSSTPRGKRTSTTFASRSTAKVESPKPATATNPMEARYASRVQKDTIQEPVKTEKTVTEATITPDQVRYTRATGFQGGTSPSSTGGQIGEKPKDDIDGRWVGQYKTTNSNDWIGLGANLAGTIGSYFINKSLIGKTPMPVKPIMAQATKLKTRYNINPQLTEIRESEQANRAAVRRNTQSSKASLAREQRLMNEARSARNQLYGQKENIETQLINQDRLNRQSVNMQNVRSYNEYLNRLTAAKMAQNEAKISNINNLIYGLTGSVNSILDNVESRRITNNTIRAIAAANPNVDARLIGGFDYYIDPITKKKYNKNQQLVGTING